MSLRGGARSGGAHNRRRALVVAAVIVVAALALAGGGFGILRVMEQIEANTASEGETLRLDNGRLAVIVDDRGRFTIGGVRPVNSLSDERRASETEGPDYEELSAGFPAGFENSGLLMGAGAGSANPGDGGDGAALRFGQDGEMRGLPTRIDDETIETTYVYATGLEITQTIELVENGEQAKISYEIENTSDRERTLRARLLMDTLPQSASDASVSVPEVGEIDEPMSINAAQISEVLAIRSEAAGFTNAYGSLRSEGPHPDVLEVGESQRMREQAFGYTPGQEPDEVSGGAYGVIWNELKIGSSLDRVG